MMYRYVSMLCLIVLSSTSVSQLIKFTMSSYILPDKTIFMELDIITPKSPNTYPPILYMTGVQGLIPNQFYSLFMESIASQGYITISVAKLQIPNPAKATQALKQVIDWISKNFQSIISNKAPGVTADLENKFILMGHSAAGHATTQYLNQTCGNIKLHILMDPVDGADPLGIKNDFIITPGKKLPYAVPVLVIATELDSQPKWPNPPCAPLNLSNTRFYNAMSGPKWFLNISKYGHVDFYNTQYRELSTIVCQSCKKNCDFADYRQVLKQAVTHFINAIFHKNKYSLDIIQKGKFKIPTSFVHDYMGYDPMNGGFCQRKNAIFHQNLSLKVQNE